MSDLAEQIDALLAINAKGAVSHPVPGLAVDTKWRSIRSRLPAAPHWRNTMGSEIPEWAMEEARVALISHPGKYDPMLERAARAIVAAERRGIERAAIAADATEDVVLAVEAIRQLGDAP